MKRFPVTAAAVAAAALALSACTSDDSSPQEEATQAAQQLCTDLNLLKADTAKLTALNPASATKDQLKDAYDAVQTDWENVKKSAADLREAERDALEDAAGDLKSGYEDLPGDTTGQQAVTQLQPQAQKLDQAAKAASTQHKCP
ncbi:hypothetical protein DEJ50_01640 [Streptomyces venezuelae]|uniref:NarX-like N-terminal domain-containing protein n=1 Tax=Streptomyces venezuelae TaxID=54571 RepID=A0A5P2CWV1_STRVZ|nr:hypothetical protein [Streptomyces venezuelae]QES46750.1 hypothetical protein DEJ50_01640 [Streptomyces venezuelae]